MSKSKLRLAVFNKHLHLMLSKDQHEKIRELAWKHKMSIGELVRSLIDTLISNNKKGKEKSV